jgi:hypothetical protein
MPLKECIACHDGSWIEFRKANHTSNIGSLIVFKKTLQCSSTLRFYYDNCQDWLLANC